MPALSRRRFLRTSAALPVVAALPFEAQVQSHHAPNVASKPIPKAMIDVRDLGAKGDGKTKDTLALQQSLDRISMLGGGTVVVPAGDYLTGALHLHGNTTLRLEEGASLLGSPDIEDYPLSQVRWEGKWIKGYGAFINARDAENVTITGTGKIIATLAIKGRVRNADGSPIVYGAPRPAGNVARTDVMRNPALMEFTRCKNLLVENVYTQGNDMWSTHPVYCDGVTFRNVVIHSGADGIDADSSRNIVIEGCTFETRDDCISLKSGRGMEGNTIGIPCEDVRISNCTFNDANFACIGIGSETSAGVRRVLIEHCKFIGARSHAIYIKSRPGRGAYVTDITVNDVDVSGVKQGFLRLNNCNSGLQDPYPVPGLAGVPRFANFKFSNVRVTDVPMLVQATEITPDKPLVGLTMTNITGTAQKGIELANMSGVRLEGIKITGFSGALLSTYKVTGVGLTGAATLPQPKMPDPVAANPKPYVLGS